MMRCKAKDYNYGPVKSTKQSEVKYAKQGQVCEEKDYDYGPVKSKETLLK